MMRGRFVYYLFASVLLHALVLVFPFSVTMGGLGNTSGVPVRVHLLSGDEPPSGEEPAQQKEAEQQKAPSVAGSAPATHDLPASAGPPLHTSPEREIGKASHFTPVEREDVHHPLREQRVEATQKATKQSTTTVRRKETSEATLTPRKIVETRAKTPPTRKTARKKQPVLRTTTVYRGSRPVVPSPAIGANELGATKAAPNPAQTATEKESSGDPRQAHSGRLTRVRYAKVVKPEYPEQARAQGWQGTTVLKVLVNQAGQSAEVRVYRSSGFDLLDDAAVDAMWRWEFYPARNGQQVVQSWVRVPIVFKLEEEN